LRATDKIPKRLQDSPDQRQPAESQHEMHERLINPDKEAVDRIFDLRRDFGRESQDHQHRDEGHAEQRSEEHRERFGERERLEQPAFLGFQREHRDENSR